MDRQALDGDRVCGAGRGAGQGAERSARGRSQARRARRSAGRGRARQIPRRRDRVGQSAHGAGPAGRRAARQQRERLMADIMGMMKQAAQLQSKMQELQAELDKMEIEGTAGGGMVTVTLTGKGDLKAVKLDDSLIKPGEKEIV